MKKALFFLAFLSFLIASCSSDEQGGNGYEKDDSSSSVLISSSDDAMPSSSSSATLNSSSSVKPSSSSRAASSSSSSATQSNSSSSKQSDTNGGLVCATPVPATATDYSNMKNWSIYTESPSKDVDIFLLYPTSIMSDKAEDCPYANINNPDMRSAVDRWYSQIKKVVTAHANPYLPYYRQANMFGTGCSGASMTGGAAMEDAIASFKYYLEHINKGQRPFMLLGFSQGSQPLWEMAENRLDTICGKEFGAKNRENHIVTYATGIPTRSAIAASKPVKFSTSYNDINVITAWNPYWESDTACASSKLGVRAISGPVTNPITWTIDQNYHEMTENPLLNKNTIQGARSYEKLGILLVKRKTEPATDPGCGAGSGIYMGEHGKDISLFEASIIQNMKDRIEAWNAKYR